MKWAKNLIYQMQTFVDAQQSIKWNDIFEEYDDIDTI